MKKKIFGKRLLSLLLCIIMLMGNSMNVFAGTSSSDTESASGNGGGPTSGKGYTLSGIGPAMYITIEDISIGPGTEDERKAIALEDMTAKVSSGAGVYGGTSEGAHKLYAISTDENNVSHDVQFDGSSAPSVLADWFESIVYDNSFSGFNSIENYEAVLQALDPDKYANYKLFEKGSTMVCPIITWTIGIVEYHRTESKKIQFYKPVEMCSSPAGWDGAKGSFDDFKNAVAGSSCHLGTGSNWYCKLWLGAHSGHNNQKAWGGKTEYARVSYISANGGKYYARGYWLPFDGFGTQVPSSDYSYGVDSTPNDAKADFASGAVLGDIFGVKIRTTDANLAILKNVAQFSPDTTYSVSVTLSDGTALSGDIANETTGYRFKQLGIAPWHDPTGSHFKIGPKLSMPAQPVQSSMGKQPIVYNFTVYACDFVALLEGTWWLQFGYEVTPGAPTATDVRHTLKVTVQVTDSNGTHNATPTTINASSAALSVGDATWNTDNCTNYANWTSGTVVNHTDWSFSTTQNPDVYAEIVANSVGVKSGTSDGLAADWNVSQGIPSTENLSVAVGGESFMIDLAGRVHSFGTAIGTASPYVAGNIDNNQNAQNTSAAITRTITFNVNVTDIWGVENKRCRLSCSGHKIAEWATTTDPGTPGSLGEGAGPNGTTANEFVCDVCGGTFNYVWGGGVDGYTVTDPVTGESTEVPPVTGSWSGGHHCSASVTYNCHTGEYSLSGACSGTTSSTVKNGNGQHYISGGNDKWKTTFGVDMPSNLYTDNSLLCDGYTYDLGCGHSNEPNVVHRQVRPYTFKIVETVDMYAFRELTAAKIYGLEKAEISYADSNVIKDGATGKSTSNTNLSAKVWRANGEYNGSNGRVWFTQFNQPNFRTGDGWTSTAVSSNYWLGDATVTISVIADSSVADLGNDGIVNALTTTPIKQRGLALNHFEPNDGNSTSTAYLAHPGDKLTEEQSLAEACQVVNAWQAANKITNGYTVNIISDACEIGVAGIGNQNVLSESYSIDDGITLFNYGFKSNGETYYRNHACNKAASKSALHIAIESKRFWDTYDDLPNLDSPSTLFQGYTGVPSENPGAKYSTIGTYRGSGNTFVAALSLNPGVLNDYRANGEKWSASSINGQAAPCYSNAIGTGASGSGITSAGTNTDGTVNEQTFDGYYTTFRYPNTGSFTVNHSLNGSPSGSGGNVSNHGLRNLSSFDNVDGAKIDYMTAMVISNIELKQEAQNGKYASPLKVKATYYTFLNFQNSSTCSKCSGSRPTIADRNTTINAKYQSSYSDNTLNDVVIHDPVSVQYWQVIGNGYGDYDGNGPAVNESGEDFRENTRGMNENEKSNYAVIGNTLHIWATDFGDFYEAYGNQLPGAASWVRGTGSTEQGADITTGVINSNAKGYVNNMNTGRWVKERAILFEFPVAAHLANGDYIAYPANTWINLGDLRCDTLTGNGSVSTAPNGSATNATTGAFHGATNALQDFKNDDKEFKYGLDYEFIILTSASESTGAGIHFRERAINEGSTIDCSQMSETNKIREGNYQADSCVYRRDAIEMVGRIGNLALEDTGDFRFSNLFKKAEDTWLIDGVIHRVNTDYPVNILSVDRDILGDIRNHSDNLASRSHSTLTVTDYTYGNLSGLGKAGSWLSLPLTAEKNPIEELCTEQMRLGYASYFDIETIGNYYGLNYKEDGSYNDGYMAASEEGTEDTRDKVMKIKPYYYLYDYELGKFYAIDLYSGSSGKYTKFYSSTDTSKVKKTSDSSLYIDLPNEDGRRNTTQNEKDVTAKVLNTYGLDRAAYLKSDYIGTSMGITLDANDIDYIGSNIKYNVGNTNQLGNGVDVNTGSYKDGNRTKAIEFIQQSQRWYFTLNVPSSTIATYPEADASKQTDIVTSHELLKKEHPNSVIIAFADITVTGDVYTLLYDAKTINGGNPVTITLFGPEKPKDWKDSYSNTVIMEDGENKEGTPAYSRDGKTAISSIPSRYAPLVVYDAFDTSNKDLDTYGTH